MKKPSNLLPLAALACLLPSLSACGKFFPPLNQCTDCTTAVSYMYVANQSSTPAIAGVILTTTTTPASGSTAATSTLSVKGTPSSDYALDLPPTALAITPGNTFLYVGEGAGLVGGVYVYAIDTDRSLALQSSISPVATTTAPVAMQVDPTGAYLVVLNYSTSSTEAVIASYAIDSSTGALTLAGRYTIPHIGAAQQMAISPTTQSSGIQNVVVTLGGGGIEAFTLNSSTGVLTDQGNITPVSTTNGSLDLGVAIDPSNNFVYVTETAVNLVRAFTFTTSVVATPGGLAEVTGSFSTGGYPSSVMVDANDKYVYVTNKTAATISGFTIDSSTGALTASATTFATGTNPVALAEDATKTWVGAVNIGGSPDLRMFSFDTTTAGNLDKALDVSTANTSPAAAALIVATH